MTNSLWSDHAELPAFPTLQGHRKTDVLIIGGGMAGLLCAHELRQAGVDYILVEADRIACGITKNTTAKITSQHGLIYDHLLRQRGREIAAGYLAANEKAIEVYSQLCQSIPCGFETKPNYVYTLSHPERVELELLALQELGYPAQYENDLPLPFSVKGAVKFPGQAQFDPLRFLGGLCPGLNIFENSKVTQLTKHTALTNDAQIHFDKLVIATHFPFLNKHGMYFMKLYQQRSYVMALEGAQDVDGMYIGDTENSLSFRNAGKLLLLGGGGHRTGKHGESWAALGRFARKHYPDARVTHRWATQDCMSLDKVPYIGQYSRSTPHVYVASGFNKWGMTSSMVSAMVLRDLVLGIDNPWAKVFSPQRSMLEPQLFVNLTHTAGGLLSLSPKRCPHMGCVLKWNRQEHSWDCPCHGSRFTENGQLIDNPATDDLKP